MGYKNNCVKTKLRAVYCRSYVLYQTGCKESCRTVEAYARQAVVIHFTFVIRGFQCQLEKIYPSNVSTFYQKYSL